MHSEMNVFSSGRGWRTTQTRNHRDMRENKGRIQLHSEPVSLVSTSLSQRHLNVLSLHQIRMITYTLDNAVY